jgi:hypothetical protein
MRIRRDRDILTLALVLALGAGLSTPALARPGRGARAATHQPQVTEVAERSPKVDKPAPAKSGDASDKSAATRTDAAGDTTATTTTANGGKVKTKTYTFGAMDVEGKLKTPQLLYFLNRVKLELDMSAPDKRSFMKELSKSADDKNL